MNQKNKTNNNHLNQRIKKSLGTFSGTTTFQVLTNKRDPNTYVSGHKSQNMRTKSNLQLESTLQDELFLILTNVFVKTQIGGKRRTLYLYSKPLPQ